MRAATGATPHAYVTGRRLARAQLMLTDRSARLPRIAFAGGLSSSRPFGKPFLRVLGATLGTDRTSLASEACLPRARHRCLSRLLRNDDKEGAMTDRSMEGGCYCRPIRYRASGPPILGVQCYCRACQHISGGGPNEYALIEQGNFDDTSGSPANYRRCDLPRAVNREFCFSCGIHIPARRPGLRKLV